MTAPLNLDALEAAARAAAVEGWYEARDRNNLMSVNTKVDADYIIAASPAAVLDLFERLRTAEAEAARERGRANATAAMLMPVPQNGEIAMVAITERNGRRLQSIRLITPGQLMTSKDGGFSLIKHHAIVMAAEITGYPEVFHG